MLQRSDEGFGPGQFTELAWIPPEDHVVSFEDICDTISTLSRAQRAFRWWIGDLIAYAEAAHGEKYTQAMELTGYEYSTLTNTVYVCKHIPPENRVDLGFSLHEAVASLPHEEQARILSQAAAEGWVREDVYAEKRRLKDEQVDRETERIAVTVDQVMEHEPEPVEPREPDAIEPSPVERLGHVIREAARDAADSGVSPWWRYAAEKVFAFMRAS